MNNSHMYYLDIDAISDFIAGNGNNKSTSTEINEMYEADEEGKLKLITKSVSENKVDTENDKSIRFHVLTELFEALHEYDGDEDGDNDFGTMLKMNTMLTYGIIKENKSN